eukprot:CAMPEP_0201516500 /NCGR_PEP_ID=MMETSP0161_2-20130828/7813_1 /ASSEMBLY_ACC=CAM_ASM_000251 /TAXON_ID=180227 /ORGANISM="Neoparamoeba aestuarina, Strain SoJaBio B1-5/56/2" /LENGTH=312 /DNA_ID=CAMNT_0047913657 /DNA_START=138 /DNA_END=1076 /DNA_ORIENTATION=+
MADSKQQLQGVSSEERFSFDLNGFLVVRGALTQEEVKELNESIDAQERICKERGAQVRNTEQGTSFSGDGKTGRIDLGGMLGWQSPHRERFRNLLCHPKLVPYLHAFVGRGYRLDHSPLIIKQIKGSEGFSLHGGPFSSNGQPNFNLDYKCINGTIRTSLLAMSVQLTDHHEGGGGFCVVRGSHKSNFPVPVDMIHGRALEENIYQPVTKAGDVVFFSEATTHGCLPWNANYERRVSLWRFAPSNTAYGRAYVAWPKEFLEGMTAEQKLVMSPPYNFRLERPHLNDDMKETIHSRAKEKKEFDRQIFGTDFY